MIQEINQNCLSKKNNRNVRNIKKKIMNSYKINN